MLKNLGCNGQDKVKGTTNKFPNSVLPSKGTCSKIQVKNRPKVARKVPLVKAEKLCPQVKVGRAEYKIPYFNRFSPLDRSHTVIEPPSNAGICLHDNCNPTEATGLMASHDKENKKDLLRNKHQSSSAGTISGFPTSLSYQDQILSQTPMKAILWVREIVILSMISPLGSRIKYLPTNKYSPIVLHYRHGINRISLNSVLFPWVA